MDIMAIKKNIIGFFALCILSSFAQAVPIVAGALGAYSICNDATNGNCIGTIVKSLDGFTFDVTPTTFTVPNCQQGQELKITVRNPLYLSSVLVYANKEEICRIASNMGGTTQECKYIFPAKNAGAFGTEQVALVIDAIGEPKSNDEGSGATKVISLTITHQASGEEQYSRSRIDDAKDDNEKALNKILTYEEIGSMTNARSKIEGNPILIQRAEQAFSQCQFSTANDYASKVSTQSQAAIDQANVDYDSLKTKQQEEMKKNETNQQPTITNTQQEAKNNTNNDSNLVYLLLAILLGVAIAVGYYKGKSKQKTFIICPKCGTKNEETHKRCHSCGENLLPQNIEKVE